MKIVLFGASGALGQRILTETLARGHEVTAVVRDPATFDQTKENVKIVSGDVLDSSSVQRVATGAGAVISAVGPGGGDPQLVRKAAHSLLNGLTRAGVKRLLVVGGAGSLEVAPEVQLLDTPEFPAAWKPIAVAHRDALDIYYTATGLDWTYFSPAAMIAPGERRGRYRTGSDQLLTDTQGQSHISSEDFAVAILDEVEQPQAIRQRVTVAY